MATKIINVSELKTKMATLLDQLDRDEIPIFVTQYGKPKAVMVNYKEYEALLKKLEDLEDILAMKDALSSPEKESISLTDYERRRASKIKR